MDRGESLKNQVVAGPQMCAFVAEDGRDFGVGEGGQRAFAEHHTAAYAGQTVRERLGHPKDAQVAGPRADLGGHPVTSDAEQVDQHAVVGTPATGVDRHPQHRHCQARTDQYGEREHADVQHPQRPAEPPDTPTTLAVGRPSAPGINNRLAIAIPALNADSTAASAIACHNTTVARGARNGQSARANRAGTGPTSSAARMVKASADTLPVSLSPSVPR